MKHSPRIVLWLIVLFLAAQYVGLYVVNQYVDYPATLATGNFTVADLPDVAGQEIARPDIEEEVSPLYIVGAIIVGTILLLLIIKWGKAILWKLWFFFAVALCLHFAAYAFLKGTPYASLTSLGLAVAFGAWKIWRPNVVVQNLTELFLYGGLAAIFFSVVNIWAMLVILVLISLYDAYAVWKSKHMVKLAKFQSASGVFAGLFIPYSMGKTMTPAKGTTSGVRTAVLGGGDIGFPLLFAASVLKEYALAGQAWLALLIPPFAALALFGLLVFGKQDRFYPAMPFISAGCLVGLVVVWLVRFFI